MTLVLILCAIWAAFIVVAGAVALSSRRHIPRGLEKSRIVKPPRGSACERNASAGALTFPFPIPSQNRAAPDGQGLRVTPSSGPLRQHQARFLFLTHRVNENQHRRN